MPNLTKYSKNWENLPDFRGWLTQVKDNVSRARCSWCNADFSIAHGGKNDIVKHMRTKKHQEVVKSKLTTKPVIDCFGKFFYILKFVLHVIIFLFIYANNFIERNFR